MAFPRPQIKNLLGEHAPRLSQFWGAFGVLTFPLSACTFSVSRYAADYGYLIAYFIYFILLASPT